MSGHCDAHAGRKPTNDVIVTRHRPCTSGSAEQLAYDMKATHGIMTVLTIIPVLTIRLPV